MRPLTLVLSALALVCLVLLGSYIVKLRGQAAAQVADDELGGDVADAGERLVYEPATTIPPSLARYRGRSVPRFDPSVFAVRNEPPPPASPSPAAPEPSGEEEERERLRQEAKKDGFLFREAGSAAVYVVQNGTKFHVPSEQEFKALGFSWNDVREVAPGSLDFLTARPPERSLFRERGDPRVYFYENGQKRWIVSGEVFDRWGHRWSDVRLVPKGSLGDHPTGTPVQ
jgi:hypothetical protein